MFFFGGGDAPFSDRPLNVETGMGMLDLPLSQRICSGVKKNRIGAVGGRGRQCMGLSQNGVPNECCCLRTWGIRYTQVMDHTSDLGGLFSEKAM